MNDNENKESAGFAGSSDALNSEEENLRLSNESHQAHLNYRIGRLYDKHVAVLLGYRVEVTNIPRQKGVFGFVLVTPENSVYDDGSDYYWSSRAEHAWGRCPTWVGDLNNTFKLIEGLDYTLTRMKMNYHIQIRFRVPTVSGLVETYIDETFNSTDAFDEDLSLVICKAWIKYKETMNKAAYELERILLNNASNSLGREQHLQTDETDDSPPSL